MFFKNIPFEENFIFNKNEANISEIQNLLEFSSIFGKEQFFVFEKFYKKGDERNLIKDYNTQQKGVEFFKKQPDILSNLKIKISKIKNIRNLYRNKFYKLSETDLFDLKQFILNFKKISLLFETTNIKLIEDTPDVISILDIFEKKNKDISTFYISEDYTEKLHNLYQKLKKVENQLLEEQNKIEKNINKNFLDISFGNQKIILKESEKYKKFNDYINFFEIIEDNPVYIKIKLKNTELIKKLEDLISDINEKIIDEKENILENISKKIFEKREIILESFKYIGIIDSFLAKVTFAIKYNGIIPEINYDKLLFVNAKNLYLENMLKKENLEYTPLSIELNKGLAVITGSNMGGKTWVLKTIAQIAYIVHAGLMVPAQKVSIPLFNGIFISSSQNLQSMEGLSSFGFELFSLRLIWNFINNFYLILLDEPAKGTNPYEGKSIVKALAKTLAYSNSFSVITTHYDEIINGIICKKFIIKGINEEKFIQYIDFLYKKSRINIDNKNIDKTDKKTKNNELNNNYLIKDNLDIKKIHKFIDHNIIEIKDKLEVPKNAIKLIKLFNFDEGFISLCEKYLKEEKKD